MITQHMGLALDLSKVKAIYIDDMKLIFEVDNILQKVFNELTEEEEIRSFQNAPIVKEFMYIDNLSESFKAWVAMWEEYKENSK
ncbi:MAG: hypothetical protein EOO99_06340 [Pedobacter sp.]|nr:MAG: hypothetical protein EOO99_06340 [Pedobacter sp.]